MDTKAARETLKALMKWIPNTAARTQIDGLAHLALDELDKANERSKLLSEQLQTLLNPDTPEVDRAAEYYEELLGDSEIDSPEADHE